MEYIDDTDIFLDETTACPVCDGQGTYLGQQGPTIHLRCRDCGCDFHTSEDD